MSCFIAIVMSSFLCSWFNIASMTCRWVGSLIDGRGNRGVLSALYWMWRVHWESQLHAKRYWWALWLRRRYRSGLPRLALLTLLPLCNQPCPLLMSPTGNWIEASYQLSLCIFILWSYVYVHVYVCLYLFCFPTPYLTV